MKKFLIVMLVLGLASAANAAILNLEVQVNSTPYTGWDCTPGDVVQVSIVQDVPDTAGNGGTIEVDFVGANPTITDMTPDQVYDPIAGTMYGWTWTLNGGVEFIGGAARKAAAGSLGVGTPGSGSIMDPIHLTPYSSTYLFTFEFTEQTMVDFNSNTTWDNYDQSVDVGAGVMVLPEPMTIALLGLGGLFLRRRK